MYIDDIDQTLFLSKNYLNEDTSLIFTFVFRQKYSVQWEEPFVLIYDLLFENKTYFRDLVSLFKDSVYLISEKHSTLMIVVSYHMLTISYGYRKKKKVFFCQHQRTYFLFHTKLHNLTKLFEGGWFDLHHSLKDLKKKRLSLLYPSLF